MKRFILFVLLFIFVCAMGFAGVQKYDCHVCSVTFVDKTAEPEGILLEPICPKCNKIMMPRVDADAAAMPTEPPQEKAAEYEAAHCYKCDRLNRGNPYCVKCGNSMNFTLNKPCYCCGNPTMGCDPHCHQCGEVLGGPDPFGAEFKCKAGDVRNDYNHFYHPRNTDIPSNFENKIVNQNDVSKFYKARVFSGKNYKKEMRMYMSNYGVLYYRSFKCVEDYYKNEREQIFEPTMKGFPVRTYKNGKEVLYDLSTDEGCRQLLQTGRSESYGFRMGSKNLVDFCRICHQEGIKEPQSPIDRNPKEADAVEMGER